MGFEATKDEHIVIPLHRPGPDERFFFFISGIVTSVPLTLFANQLSGSLIDALPAFYATVLPIVIFAPFIEEFAKAFPPFYRHGETQRSIFSLGFLVGLGFGVTEFLLYVFLLGVPAPLRLPGVLFHAASTSIASYGVAMKRIGRYYLVAVGLHFLNNFSAVVEPLWLIGGPIAVGAAYLLSWRLYRQTADRMVV